MRFLTTILALTLAIPVAAQQREIRDANLPPDLEREILAMYDSGALRIDGEAVIGASEVVPEHVAATGGPLRIVGEVRGDVVMVGGDVVMEPGGTVTGDVTVVGGEVRMSEGSRVAGTITSYGTAERRWVDDRDRDRGDDEWRRRRREGYDTGGSQLTLRTGASYNRVEGLPIMFGPVIQTAGPNPLRLEAFAIWRTEEGTLDADRMGYRATAEQFLGGRRTLSLGASAFSVVDPMDRWQIRDLEASLAAALFHDDYRDHYERTGWSAFVRARPIRGVDARVEFRDEDHEAMAAGDPWSLFDGGDVWRPQPVIGIGDVQTVAGSIELDYRDDRRWSAGGWLARLGFERPVGGALARPELGQVAPYPAGALVDPNPSLTLPGREYDMDFTTGFVDLRRYNPVGWASELNLRVVAGGTLSERPLPAQYQHALGGPGTLPGFTTFHGDCGARAQAGRYQEERFFPAYGCDRFAAFQVEYRGGLSLGFGFGDPDDDHWYREWADWGTWDVDLDPSWVVFFDAAQGWAYADPSIGFADRDTGVLYDAGVGILLGDLGIYGALPLNGDVDQDPRFLIRLGRRF